jgi:hypothetical protein
MAKASAVDAMNPVSPIAPCISESSFLAAARPIAVAGQRIVALRTIARGDRNATITLRRNCTGAEAAWLRGPSVNVSQGRRGRGQS